MGALRADEKKDLKELQQRLTARIEYLEEQESYGTITAIQKNDALNKEFGPEYRETLSFINDVLHRTNKRYHTVPHIKEAATITYLILAVTILAALLWPGITGGVTDTNTQQLNTTLQKDKPLILPYQQSMIINDIQTTTDTTIKITDATNTHTLYQEGRCQACNIRLAPPYMLRANTETTITSITYTITP